MAPPKYTGTEITHSKRVLPCMKGLHIYTNNHYTSRVTTTSPAIIPIISIMTTSTSTGTLLITIIGILCGYTLSGMQFFFRMLLILKFITLTSIFSEDGLLLISNTYSQVSLKSKFLSGSSFSKSLYMSLL